MTATPDFPPSVEAYLASLAVADPRERAETVAAVREHAAELLARYGTDEVSVRRVLDELGPVETRAAEVTPAPAPVSAPGETEAMDLVLVVLAVVLWPLSPVTLVWAIVRLRTGVGNRALQWLIIALSVIPSVGGIVLLLMHAMSLAG
ncbi:hypothetical protein [Promicromonospora sp. NPDC090134]|uniref:hypothetical protein n=1 Tax=Promicromonospora sp. NPDC090134 TaxID=3364408 RepID=UPI00380FF37F